jgi:predicted homoserine dehydrogenase-like protein
MIAPDKKLAALDAAHTPIRVALVGAGVTARMIARQLRTPVPGLRLVAIANRSVEHAIAAFGGSDVTEAGSVGALEDAIAAGRPTVVADAGIVCRATNVDVVVEVTGTVEFGAEVALAAIRHGKHVVLVNAELDSTLGPILKFHADRAGVVITNTDGDEPGVAMTLLRYVRSLGLRAVGAGNLKGLVDHQRTPLTQREFAARHQQNAAKVTSFADGTKLAMECAILANATGFHVGRRGMYGPACAHVREMARLLPQAQLLEHGLVDYALGAEPHTGAFVLVHETDPRKQRELAYYKMGDGPFYVFYTPYHLPHLQIAATIAGAALGGDATVAPLGAPVCEVVAVAKRDLPRGVVLDGIGGFDTYGVIENAAPFAAEHLLPMGVAEGCRLRRTVRPDQPLTYADVDLPAGRLCDSLRAEQIQRFQSDLTLERVHENSPLLRWPGHAPARHAGTGPETDGDDRLSSVAVASDEILRPLRAP